MFHDSYMARTVIPLPMERTLHSTRIRCWHQGFTLYSLVRYVLLWCSFFIVDRILDTNDDESNNKAVASWAEVNNPWTNDDENHNNEMT